MASTFLIQEILGDVARMSNVPDFTASTNVTLSQATYWLTQSARSLSARMRQHFGDDADFIRLTQITTTPGFNSVSLPPDCGEVQAVVWVRTTSDFRLLDYAQLEDLEDLAEPTHTTWESGTQPAYRLEGSTIALYPYSENAEKLWVWYTDHLDLTGQDDFAARLDGDRWMTLDVAIRVAISQGRDAAPLQQEKAMLEANLFSQSRRRQTTRTSTIRDAYSANLNRAYRDRWSR